MSIKRDSYAPHQQGWYPGGEVERRAVEFAWRLIPVFADIQAKGITTLPGIACELNARGIKTAQNGVWYPMSVKRVLERQRS